MELTILLVDDHAVVRAGYRRFLEVQPGYRVIAEASDSETALRLYQAHLPDVVIMDIVLPGMGGLETSRRILARHPTARILGCSIHDNLLLVERALEAGILGYVTKSSDPEVLMNGVRQVAAGQRYLGPDVAQALALHHLGQDDSPLRRLSGREFEVFRMIAAGRSREQVAETLHLSVKTVSNYLSQIKGKLGLASESEMVHLAMQYELLNNGI